MESWRRFINWCRQPNMIKLHTFNPNISMAGLLKGAKVGAVSGVIYGALLGFVGNVVYNIIRGIIRGRLEMVLDSFMTEGMGYFGPILVYIFFGAICGLIFGLLFAVLYDKLPGKTPVGKGIVTSIIFWAIILLGLPPLMNLRRWGFEGLYWFVRSSFYREQAVTGMYLAIFSGWLLGRFWTGERLGKL